MTSFYKKFTGKQNFLNVYSKKCVCVGEMCQEIQNKVGRVLKILYKINTQVVV